MIFQILEYSRGDRKTRAEFLEWTERLIMGIGTVSPQLYFVPTLSPRSRSRKLAGAPKKSIDRTTLSDLQLGRLNRLSLKKLSRIADAF